MATPRQAEQQFFPDPSIDRLMGVVFNLAAELQVMRERVSVLEHLLEQRGVVRPSAVSADAPTLPAQPETWRPRMCIR